MTGFLIAQLQYFRLTNKKRMFHGDPNDPTSLRVISTEDYAKIKTVILSATQVQELPALGNGCFRVSTSKGNGEIIAQCKNGYVFIRQLTWKEKAWH